MQKKSLYTDEVKNQCLSRIEAIDEAKPPEWGKMNAAQMFSHCAEIFEVMNGKPLENTPFIVKLFKGFIRKGVLNEQPYKQGIPTSKQYIRSDHREFQIEKERLLQAMDKFCSMDKEVAENIEHALFGKMTVDERGWAMYKHLDHHLTQFGV